MSGDVEGLRKAKEGWGSAEDTLIKIIINRNYQQRQPIKALYKATYGKDLVEDFKKEIHAKFEEEFVALFTEPIEMMQTL